MDVFAIDGDAGPDGTNGETEGNTVSSSTARRSTQELRGVMLLSRRRRLPTTQARRAPLRGDTIPPCTVDSAVTKQVASSDGIRMWDYNEHPLRRTGNSGMPKTEDAEAVARPCIDANFTSGETTGRQGYRNCGDKETLLHTNCAPNGGGVLRDYPARA